VPDQPLPEDPLWPRASAWLIPPAEKPHQAAIGVIGVPTHETSITPTRADTTPAAVREALKRYSTYSASHGVDVGELTAFDFGDVRDPDGPVGEAAAMEAVWEARLRCELLLAIGGDNSLTYSVVRGLFGRQLRECGLITIDAHHDIREGISNGSPVRRLLEAGLPGENAVQIGIADFSNSAEYARRARDAGITVLPRSALRSSSMAGIAAQALAIAGAGGRPVFVDVDVDVCDRAEVPACHAAAPGGISADELRQLVFALASDPRVAGMDIAEVDAAADAPDGRTVRLAALLIVEAAAGFACR